jgi:hypothetical protein
MTNCAHPRSILIRRPTLDAETINLLQGFLCGWGPAARFAVPARSRPGRLRQPSELESIDTRSGFEALAQDISIKLRRQEQTEQGDQQKQAGREARFLVSRI